MNKIKYLLIPLLLFAGVVQAASSYPLRPIRMIVAYPPGGGTDQVGRVMAEQLTQTLGQQVVVDNRGGATGNIGTELAARAAPDGYTLLMGNVAPNAVNVSLFRKLGFDPVKDFAPVSVVAETAQVLVVHPSIPVRNVRELVALLKRRPGEMVYSSAGNGSQPHLSAELFASMTGTRMLHVPYKGGPQAMTDLIAGHVALSFATAPSAVPNVRSGKVRALGVSTRARIPALPDVPTIAESGVPGYDAVGYFGLVAPAGTPAAIIERLHASVLSVLKDPAIRRSLSDQGAEPMTSTPAEYAALIRDEVAKWGRVVRESGARID